MPPRWGSLKFNVDRSWLDSSLEGSIAGVCHDSQGMLVARFTMPVQAFSTLGIETLAAKEALLFLIEEAELKSSTDLRSRLDD